MFQNLVEGSWPLQTSSTTWYRCSHVVCGDFTPGFSMCKLRTMTQHWCSCGYTIEVARTVHGALIASFEVPIVDWYELFSVKSNLASCSILRANNFHKSIFKNKAKPVPKKSIINVPEVFKEGVQLSLPALVLPSFRVIPDWPLLVASTEGSIGTVLWVLVSRCERPRRRVVDCDHRWCV